MGEVPEGGSRRGRNYLLLPWPGGGGIGEARPGCTVGLLEHELRCAGDSDECLETLVRSRSWDRGLLDRQELHAGRGGE